jgi:hypothetical protein
MDPRDRYFLTRQRLDARRAGAQRARLVRGEWTADKSATPILARVELAESRDGNGRGGLPIVGMLSVLRLARAARDA